MELGNVIKLLENSQFAYCLNSISRAKENCIDAIKELNKISKDTRETISEDDLKLIQVISKYLLNFYDSLSKESGSDLQEKVKWLASKINGQVFPPIIEFDGSINTLNERLISPTHTQSIPTTLLLPPHVNADFVECPISSLSGDVKDLQNLYQDLLTNCSFVCAILGIVHVDPKLLTSRIILPRTSSHASSRRRYCRVQIYVNGCERLVTIDNTLPMVVGEVDRHLVIRSSSKVDLWWPALLEKAYLTIMGHGYNFKGSNMALDVYMICGWIPEVLRIKGQLPEELSRILKDGNTSRVILGLGVGAMSESLSKLLGLIPEHDYSIVGTRFNQETGLIELNVRNPWSRATDESSSWWVPEPKLHNFNYLYVNWNKLMFQYEQEIIIIGSTRSTFWKNDLYDRPQISLQIEPSRTREMSDSDSDPDSDSLWLLLERYLPSKVEDLSDSGSIINLLVYATENGEKVLTTEQYPSIYKSPVGTNNRTLLIKLKLPQLTVGQSYSVVIESIKSSTFTLKSFCNTRHSLRKAKSKYRYTSPIVEDEWNTSSSGGNFTKSTFIYNPQYTLAVPEDNTDVSIGLFGELPNQYYNFHLFSCDSIDSKVPLKDILSLRNLIQGTNYKMGGCVNNFQGLKAGAYRLVFSTYEAFTERRLPLKFKILINSSNEGVTCNKCFTNLGLFLAKRKIIPWSNRNRIKINFETTSTNTNVNFHIQFCKDPEKVDPLDISDYRPAIRASIFCKLTENPISINEQWSDSIYGIFLGINLLSPPQPYILLIERFETGSGGCMIDVGSSRRIEYREN